jgi:polar amino acid transport system permease protein
MSPTVDLLLFHAPAILSGAVITIKLTILSFIFSLFIGLAWASVRLYAHPTVAKLADTSALFFRGLPELLIILMVYYLHEPFVSFLSFGTIGQLSNFNAGVLALSLCYGAYSSEVIRYAILTVPLHQVEAANAFALPAYRRFMHIIMPQAFFRSIKGLTNLLLSLMKDTSLLSIISVPELLRITHLLIASIKHPFTFYMVASVLYLSMTLVILFFMRFLDKVYFYRFSENGYTK